MQKKHLIGAGITAFSVILGLLWLIPLIWLIGTAFSVPSFHMTLFPTTAFTLDNIKYVWNAIPFGTYYINTLTLVVCTFAVQFFTSTLAAYALAVLDFKGQALVFAVIFMQIIIPNDVLITPNFMTLSDLKLIDTKIGMMLPFYGSAMAIFLLRQHFKSIPKALAEAAKIDGATIIQQIRNVELPALKPVIVIQFILSAGNIMSIGFEKVYAMQTDLNKITSDIIPTYVYRLGLEMGDYGYSTAVGLFNSIVNLILLVAVNYVVSKLNEGEGL